MIVVITISLGIGGAVALFSVTNAVLLRQLPYADPGRLVVGYADYKKRFLSGSEFSTANYLKLRSATMNVFEELGAVYTGEQTLAGADGSMEAVRYGLTSPNLFKILGTRILFGRNFVEADGRSQGLSTEQQGTAIVPVAAILSYEYWQRRYGGNRKILGSDIRGPGYVGQEIVGVLAPGFQLLFPPSDVMQVNPDIWVVHRMSYEESDRLGYWLRLVGRLRPGISIGHAQAQVDAVASEMRIRDRKLDLGGFRTRLEPMQDNLVRKVRPRILILMGGALLLLLIACANVSSLMLARSAARDTEVAIQAALGAANGRLIWRVFVEALMVAAGGAVLGIVVAQAAIHALSVAGPRNVPRLDSVRIDGHVLAFAVSSLLACALLCALAPAVAIRKMDLMQLLRGSGKTGAVSVRHKLRNAVLAAEVALAFVLTVATGLMVRSFMELQKVDPGFDPHRLLIFQVVSEIAPLPQRLNFQTQLWERLRALRGVESATVLGPPPLSLAGRSQWRWGFQDMRTDTSKGHSAYVQTIGPCYFETFRTALLQGRDFERGDDPSRVTIIDEAIASRYFAHRSPVGQHILLAAGSRPPVEMEIVGVAGTQRVLSLAEPGTGQLFFQDGFSGYTGDYWAIRTSGDPFELVKAARTEVANLDRRSAVVHMESMDQLMDRAQASTRLALSLIGSFAGIAVVLVTVGLYGVLATAVRQRTAEIGIRMALGAKPGAVARFIVAEGLRLSAVGIAIGLLLALVLTRLMTALLVGVKPFDPMTFLIIAFVFLGLSALSAWIPARRAAALDPAAALRDE